MAEDKYARPLWRSSREVRRETRSVAEPLEGSARDPLQLALERVASRVVKCDEQICRHERLHSETDKRVSEVCELVRRRAHDQERRIAAVSNDLHGLTQESLPSFQLELDKVRRGLDEYKQSIAATLTGIHVELAHTQSTLQSTRATQLENDPAPGGQRQTARTMTFSTGDGSPPRRELPRGCRPEDEELSVQKLRDEIERARTDIEEIACEGVSHSDLWTVVECILSLTHQMQAALDSRVGAVAIEHSHSQAVDTVFADLAAFAAWKCSNVTSKAARTPRKMHPLHFSGISQADSFNLATGRSQISSGRSLAHSPAVQLTEDQERQMAAFSWAACTPLSGQSAERQMAAFSRAASTPLSEQSAASSSREHPFHFGSRGPVSGAHSNTNLDLATCRSNISSGTAGQVRQRASCDPAVRRQSYGHASSRRLLTRVFVECDEEVRGYDELHSDTEQRVSREAYPVFPVR
eukprot:NODE_4799_length_1845_cov_10.923749.p1 GENE.NODE_4799_length_1845_cov_10.923749~~NODE_4799_length_1845_cov_10.923749.p1  ORF type:complete len:467 (-),score=71.53 NODE_4799_length_1845_cov_10.923749:267-1667(-)